MPSKGTIEVRGARIGFEDIAAILSPDFAANSIIGQLGFGGVGDPMAEVEREESRGRSSRAN